MVVVLGVRGDAMNSSGHYVLTLSTGLLLQCLGTQVLTLCLGGCVTYFSILFVMNDGSDIGVGKWQMRCAALGHRSRSLITRPDSPVIVTLNERA